MPAFKLQAKCTGVRRMGVSISQYHLTFLSTDLLRQTPSQKPLSCGSIS
jgi:hypothetical protein